MGFRARLRSLSTQIITCFIPVVAAPGKDIIELACDGIAIAERRPAAAANPLFHIKYKEHERCEFIFIQT